MKDPVQLVRRNPRVVHRALAEGQGGVLLHLDSGAYHGVNDVGSLIWELVDGDSTVPEIAERLRRQLDDPPDSVETDVETFVAAMRERDLIVPA